MSEQQPQVSKMTGALVEHQRGFEVMSTDERQWVITNTIAAIAIIADAIKTRVTGATVEAKKLLESIFVFTTVAVKKFVAKDNFVEGKTTNDVSIAWLEDNFKKYLLPKIETDVGKTKLKVHKLLSPATDLPQEGNPGIIPELNGWHRTMLAHLFQLLAHKQQKEDYSWIISYICDDEGTLWAVSAGWSTDSVGWNVRARSVECPYKWHAARQVVSR